jgi:hypothetical protein
MNFSKINLGHYGTQHVLSKYENLLNKYFQLTKVATDSLVNFNFESQVYYEFVFLKCKKIYENKVFRVSNFISIA